MWLTPSEYQTNLSTGITHALLTCIFQFSRRAVLFVDTDGVPAPDTRLSANALHNEIEATLVHQVRWVQIPDIVTFVVE